MGHQYQYGYDEAGNLAADVSGRGDGGAVHLRRDAPVHRGTDPRGNALPSTTYYATASYKASETRCFRPQATPTTGGPHHHDYVSGPGPCGPWFATATASYSVRPIRWDRTTTNVYDANHNLTSVHRSVRPYHQLHLRRKRQPDFGELSEAGAEREHHQHYHLQRLQRTDETTDELGNSRAFSYDANFWPKLAGDA